MHILIIHCHPEPTSFNAALTNIATHALLRSGHTVEVSDLYAEAFDPVEKPDHYDSRHDPDFFSALAEQRRASETATLPSDVQIEIARLERADIVVFQFPLWWHAQPAMLKGWFDRVFVNGGIYTSTMRYNHGFFRGKKAICSVTTGAPEDCFGCNRRGGDINLLLWPMQYSLHYAGFSVLPPFVSFGIQGNGYAYQDEKQFTHHLERCQSDWLQRLDGLERDEPLCFPGWDDWDRQNTQVSEY